MKVGVLTNLNSRKNLGRSQCLPDLPGNCCVVRQTRELSEIRPALECFIESGCDCWVADGGDGTLHWMLNEGREVLRLKGLWKEGQPFPLVVPSNGGTIDFVARTAGIKAGTGKIVSLLADQATHLEDLKTVSLDTVLVRGRLPEDSPGTWSFERTGFAVAVGGIGQKFFRKYYELPERNPMGIIDISAKASIGYIANRLPARVGSRVPERIRDIGTYILSGTAAEVEADGRRFDYGRYQGLHVSSVEIDFGTMKLFEYARQPGQLHIVVGTLPMHECAWKWTWYVIGKPIPGKQWHEFPGKSLQVKAAGGELLDPVIDGEMFFGFDELDIRLGPAIKFPVVS